MTLPASSPHADPDEPAAIIRELDRFPAGTGCACCGGKLCGHEVLFSVVLGAKDAPRCLSCLSGELDRGWLELRDQLAEFVQHRDCYRQAWNLASEREGYAAMRFPRCLWDNGNPPAATATDREPAETPEREVESPAAAWDAGDMACGDLVLGLRGRLNALVPGSVLKVTARDPAAPQDLPAWCRLTGHKMLTAKHPDYFIQRKET